MDKRHRSPNYPALSLPAAIEKVTALYRNVHNHAAPREVAVKAMGYQSLNGASATTLSALHKYGLLDRDGDGVKISERALRILHPHSLEERAAAIRDAASDPPLFTKIGERFPGRLPNEELLRNWLVREGFAPAAVPQVLLAYRETSELVEREAGADDLPTSSLSEAPQMQPTPQGAAVAGLGIIHSGKERQIGIVDLEGGEYVRLVSTVGLDTEEALDWAEDIIKRKRRELEKRKDRPSPGGERNDE